MQTSSQTVAGPHKTELSPERKEQLVDAINQSFELLRLNYHHLYFSAYKEVEELNWAKRLWMESLDNFSPDIILKAVHQIIKESDYLPTISRIARLCDELQTGHSLPDARIAYIDACKAESPKRNAQWKHPAIYYAGRMTGWRYLAQTDETLAFPTFKEHYDALCQRVRNGETLPTIAQEALPEKIENTLSKDENSERMANLRKELGI